ncbi:MAG: hypothetical protein CMK07_06730 [Ponticaulis sp.]|nr:hypothetical protein [Ponticaulis sp.]
MNVLVARKLKTLEIENVRLERVLSDAMLDNVVLKEMLKKMLTTLQQKRDVALRALQVTRFSSAAPAD